MSGLDRLGEGYLIGRVADAEADIDDLIEENNHLRRELAFSDAARAGLAAQRNELWEIIDSVTPKIMSLEERRAIFHNAARDVLRRRGISEADIESWLAS